MAEELSHAVCLEVSPADACTHAGACLRVGFAWVRAFTFKHAPCAHVVSLCLHARQTARKLPAVQCRIHIIMFTPARARVHVHCAYHFCPGVDAASVRVGDRERQGPGIF